MAELLLEEINRTVHALHTIKRHAYDGAVAKSPDDYANAVADLAELHGKRLDALLLQSGLATGLFD